MNETEERKKITPNQTIERENEISQKFTREKEKQKKTTHRFEVNKYEFYLYIQVNKLWAESKSIAEIFGDSQQINRVRIFMKVTSHFFSFACFVFSRTFEIRDECIMTPNGLQFKKSSNVISRPLFRFFFSTVHGYYCFRIEFQLEM